MNQRVSWKHQTKVPMHNHLLTIYQNIILTSIRRPWQHKNIPQFPCFLSSWLLPKVNSIVLSKSTSLTTLVFLSDFASRRILTCGYSWCQYPIKQHVKLQAVIYETQIVTVYSRTNKVVDCILLILVHIFSFKDEEI